MGGTLDLCAIVTESHLSKRVCINFLAKTGPALIDIANEDPGPRRSARNTISLYRLDRIHGGQGRGHMRSADSERRTESIRHGIPRLRQRCLPKHRFPTHTVTPGTRAPIQETLPGRILCGVSLHALPLGSSRHDMAPCFPFEPRLQIASHICKMRIR